MTNVATPFRQIVLTSDLDALKDYLENHQELHLDSLTGQQNATLLHYAVRRQEKQKIIILIHTFKVNAQRQRNPNSLYSQDIETRLNTWINAQDEQQNTALHYAVGAGNLDITKLLICEYHAAANKTNLQGENILMTAVKYNKLSVLLWLVSRQDPSLDLDAVNKDGCNLLHLACKPGFTAIATFLMTLDLDWNRQNAQGYTPMMEATVKDAEEILRRMLLKGFNRNIVNARNETAMTIARRQRREVMIAALNDQHSCFESILIECNKKMVFRRETSSWTMPIILLVLMHLVLVGTHILCKIEISSTEEAEYIVMGFVYVVFMGIYLSLLKRVPKKRRRNLEDLILPICAQCRVSTDDRYFHCYTCERCVYRFDHHCPWLNNCVGGHNFGRFIVFLFLLIILSVESFVVNLMVLAGLVPTYVGYRQLIDTSVGIKVIQVVLLVVALGSSLVIKLFFGQCYNLTHNTTSRERKVQRKRTQTMRMSTETGESNSFIDQENKMLGSVNSLQNTLLTTGSDMQPPVSAKENQSVFRSCYLMLTASQGDS